MSLDLSTRYLGLTLTSPVIIGASPIGDHVDSVSRYADAGAGAIVLRSLFEEQKLHPAAPGTPAAEAADAKTAGLSAHTGVDEYLEHIRTLKRRVNIPIIASVNGTHPGDWLGVIPALAEAGADALEVNFYRLPTDPTETCIQADNRLLHLISSAQSRAGTLPLSVKLSPFHSSLPHVAARLDLAHAAGLVLFNRIYQTDIDIENLHTTTRLLLSDSNELPARLRWLSILATTYPGTLVCCGGVHTTADTVKALLSGAHAVQIVSAALRRGPAACGEIIAGLGGWMYQHGFTSIDEVRDAMNPSRAPSATGGVRANYVRTLRAFDPLAGAT